MTTNMQKVIKDVKRMIQASQDATLKTTLEGLIALVGKLEELKAKKERGLNVFYEVGMATQEIRHSTFLSRLLNPECPHELGNEFLKKFLQEVYLHKNNASIIDKTLNGHKIDEIWSSKNISIKCEEHLTTEEGGRTDILIDTGSIVVVIENKVFSSTHDNQLERYENQYKDKDKILIFLTPHGEEPYDNKMPRPNWCVFDYGSILNVIDKLDVKNIKMKILLEDYKEMANTEILKKNPEVRTLSKAIWDEYSEALGLVMEYTDNASEVIKFCLQWMNEYENGKERLAIKVVESENKASIDFYTPAMENFFNNHKEQHTPKKLCCRICTEGGNVLKWYYVLMYPEKDGWSAAQKLVIPDQKKGSYTKSSQILSWEERGKPFDATLQETVKKRLQEILKKLHDFETNELTK